MRTRLEFVIQSHGVKPARLAPLAGYSRGHLARAREGEPTSVRFQEGVTDAMSHIVGRPVPRSELFEPEGRSIRALLPQTPAGRRRRKTPRQPALPKKLGMVVAGLSAAEFDTWLLRIRTTADAATEASARELADAAFALLDREPARADALYAAAVDLTARLLATPPALVAALRGYAEKGRANALRMLGRYQEAMQILIDAQQHFVDAGYCTVEIGAVRYVRASVLFKMQRWPEAQEAAAQARRIFEEEHDRTRALHARMIEGCVLVERGDLDAARAIFVRLLKQLAGKRHRDALARVYMNLGSCDLKRGVPGFARHWLHRATQLFRTLDTPSELARARWCGAKITIFEGDRTRGMRELRATMQEFERLSMPADAGFVGLDLLEELLADDPAAKEAERLARLLAEFFVAAGVTVSAARAIGHLRDAVASRTADAPLVVYVRRYVHRSEVDADNPFEPPMSGGEPA